MASSPDLYSSDEVGLTVVPVAILPALNYPTFTTTNTKEMLHITLEDSLILNSALSLESFSYTWACRWDSERNWELSFTTMYLDRV